MTKKLELMAFFNSFSSIDLYSSWYGSCEGSPQVLTFKCYEPQVVTGAFAELLENSLDEENVQSGKPMEYDKIIEMADREQPSVYTNKRELKLLLSSGMVLIRVEGLQQRLPRQLILP